MKCPACGAPVAAGERFCDCGAPLPAAPSTPGPTSAPGGKEYGAEISTANPACLVILVDQSGSMNEPIAGGGGAAKKQVVADAINRVLYNCALRCAKSPTDIRHYFDIGVWTYGGGVVGSAFPGGLVPVETVARHPRRVETRTKREPDGTGGLVEREVKMPVWFDAEAQGQTPMNAAFGAVLTAVREWVAAHANSFPPIVLNLTDGAYTDDNPATAVRELRSLRTRDGSVLVFNCHISKTPGATMTFADDTQGSELTGLARELFEFSSPLPEVMTRQARKKGYSVGPGGRGYVFNGDIVTLIDFLDIGTRAVQDRAEG